MVAEICEHVLSRVDKRCSDRQPTLVILVKGQTVCTFLIELLLRILDSAVFYHQVREVGLTRTG